MDTAPTISRELAESAQRLALTLVEPSPLLRDDLTRYTMLAPVYRARYVHHVHMAIAKLPVEPARRASALAKLGVIIQQAED